MSPTSSKEPQREVPEQILEILKTSQIGYLAVTSPKGDLYSYPVAFYFSGFKVYFMTPISAAKLRFIKANPVVSFLVDNHLLTKGAAGAMLQGRAKVFSIGKTIMSVLSVGPKMAKFAQEYPGMFTFYASGKDLPDERKLYKYRLIRIDQSTRRLSLRCTQCNGRMPSFSKLSSLSEVPPPAEHQRADCRYSLSRIARFSAEQSHGQLWPNNATRLSGKDWHCAATRA